MQDPSLGFKPSPVLLGMDMVLLKLQLAVTPTEDYKEDYKNQGTIAADPSNFSYEA